MSRRIAIVGAGPGGLAAAMLLAKAGADVTVFERHERVGGRSATIEAPSAAGTFRFDMGPTFFLYPRVLADIFGSCDLDLQREAKLIAIEPMYRLVFENGGSILATSDMEKLAAEVARFSMRDAASLPRFMAENRAKLAAFRPVLEQPFHGPLSMLRPSVLKALRMLRPHQALNDDLARYFSDERIRLAFSFQSKYLGMSPFRCPSLFTILSFMEYEHGVFHPLGGCGALMSRMGRLAKDLGADLRLGEPVQEILFEGRRATGLRTVSGVEQFDALVINADFAQTMARLVPDRLRRRWTDKKLAGKKYSCSTFMLYLGIEGDLPELAHHTILLADDYRRNVREIEAGQVPPGEPSVYVQNASVTDPSLAPPGFSTLYCLVPVGHRAGLGIDWAAEKARYRALVMKRLEKLGIHDLERRICFEKITTPTDWEHDMQVYRGVTFNLAHSLDQMLFRRPRNRFEDLDGVYLVGGGTHPGSGLPVIFESARITSRLLVDDLGITPNWSGSPTAMATPELARSVLETA